MNTNKIVHCEHCNKEFKESEQYAHYGGYYCSRECYSTLFLPCLGCGDPHHMGAKTNLNKHGEQLCDACYDKKHGLSSVTISGGQIRY